MLVDRLPPALQLGSEWFRHWYHCYRLLLLMQPPVGYEDKALL